MSKFMSGSGEGERFPGAMTHLYVSWLLFIGSASSLVGVFVNQLESDE
jgi:hypothetical protein